MKCTKKEARRSAPPSNSTVAGKRSGWIKRNIGAILIFSGLLMILCVLFAARYSAYRQSVLIRAYERASVTSIKTGDAYLRDGGSTPQPNEQDMALPSARINEVATPPSPTADASAASAVKQDDIALIGIVSIPSIDLRMAIGEGTDDHTLKYAAGHFVGTAMPGEAGNSCIAGHRNYTWGKYFNRLDELTEGDEILVERNEQTYTYSVTETFVVDPEDVWVLDPTDDARLTLITCTPVRVATQRLIVVGTLAE